MKCSNSYIYWNAARDALKAAGKSSSWFGSPDSGLFNIPDNQMATILGVSRNKVRRWRTGLSAIPDAAFHALVNIQQNAQNGFYPDLIERYKNSKVLRRDGWTIVPRSPF